MERPERGGKKREILTNGERWRESELMYSMPLSVSPSCLLLCPFCYWMRPFLIRKWIYASRIEINMFLETQCNESVIERYNKTAMPCS
jgi:hypothetical protein